jgi:hypothetical protein
MRLAAQEMVSKEMPKFEQTTRMEYKTAYSGTENRVRRSSIGEGHPVHISACCHIDAYGVCEAEGARQDFCLPGHHSYAWTAYHWYDNESKCDGNAGCHV